MTNEDEPTFFLCTCGRMHPFGDSSCERAFTVAQLDARYGEMGWCETSKPKEK